MYLCSLSSTNKIRVVDISSNWDDLQHGFVITRYTGQLNGKMTKQPDILIQRGKASRTLTEQVDLQFKSEVNKYKDKGYKEVPENPENMDESEIRKIVGEVKTDSNGFAKHMLAKPIKDVKDSSIEKVEAWYASRKIDGVRVSLYWDGKEVKTASRGGKNYDYSTIHLREHPLVVKLLKSHPNIIIDGELYKHGKSLQQISGAARLEKNAYDCDWLEYYIYDVMIDQPFQERLKILKVIQKYLQVGEFNPYKEYTAGELQVQFVPHVLITGPNKKEQAMSLHNDWVEEGFEGCVIRDANKTYGFGKRSQDMIKIKVYRDDCFIVTGKQGGLREVEDMVFILQTKEGKEFKAKPMGTLEEKEDYWNNFAEKYKGHLAECKFFYYSDDNIPLQPCVKCFRFDLENDD